MLKQGFKQDIEKIMGFIRAKVPHKIQNLLFSATIPRWLEDLSY
jgi:superfamily II DNA/RNA helicase